METSGWCGLGLGLAGIVLVLLASVALASTQARYLDTWLVLGTFPNDETNAGFERAWFDVNTLELKAGLETAGKRWFYFDDRLFSRNYDDYVDLRSYFHVKRGENTAGVVAFASTWVWVPAACECQLRVGADEEFKCWLNGEQVLESTRYSYNRDSRLAEVTLREGWNHLLFEIANQAAGRLGFYARLCTPAGAPLEGLVSSTEGPVGPLRVTTSKLKGTGPFSLPCAFCEWPYVGIDSSKLQEALAEFYTGRPDVNHALVLQASPFVLNAAGGVPPYKWRLVKGRLPEGLELSPDGLITGTCSRQAKLGRYEIEVEVKDATGATAHKKLKGEVKRRPNRWYEAARLVALIHQPEVLVLDDLPRFVEVMKRQGYKLGMVISYNNGRHLARWPTRFNPDNPWGDVVGRWKRALEAGGLKFGMYLGNLDDPAFGGGAQGGLLLVEEAMQRYNPAALWFDWAGKTGVSLDALYSMVRAYNPDTVIVLNGVQTPGQGDWDVLCLEGWGAWGANTWSVWPFSIGWGKRFPLESWRTLPDPAFEYTKGLQPDGYEMLKVMLSLIGEGWVANIDHSPTHASGIYPKGNLKGKLKSLEASPIWRAHVKMADWASPPGRPPLYEAWTEVDKGPLDEAAWGYNAISLDRKRLYLICLSNPCCKTGLPKTPELVLENFAVPVKRVLWLNENKPVRFIQEGKRVSLELEGITQDPVATLFKLELAKPYPTGVGRSFNPGSVPPGNLAWRKPAQLLSADGSHPLVASGLNVARYGVDGLLTTAAQGAYEWAWSYQVDLEKPELIGCIVVNFSHSNWATEYKVLVSLDGGHWRELVHERNCPGGRREHKFTPVKARYVRVQAIKPDGPGQLGGQMAISELEVYAAESRD